MDNETLLHSFRKKSTTEKENVSGIFSIEFSESGNREAGAYAAILDTYLETVYKEHREKSTQLITKQEVGEKRIVISLDNAEQPLDLLKRDCELFVSRMGKREVQTHICLN